MDKLEILLWWLRDCVDMESDIEFTDGVGAADLIPVIEAVINIRDIPAAARNNPPFAEYFSSPVIPHCEMNRAEAEIFNTAIALVKTRINEASK